MIFIYLAQLNFFMTTERNLDAAISYHHLYKYLLVLTEEQIHKLRNIVIGASTIAAFTDNEIEKLELKMREKDLRHSFQR